MIIDEKENVAWKQEKIELKLELIKIVGTTMHQNIAMQWEINKEWSKPVTSEDIILEAKKLYEFIIG